MTIPAVRGGSLPVALTIAGSDSGGGAGIQADLKTFHAFGVFGTSAITAVTVQNTLGVQAVHAVPAAYVRGQIDAVTQDLMPRSCKTGMLATRELVLTVADVLRGAGIAHYVLDPVMIATSGDRLLDAAAESTIRDVLLPLCTLATPNLDEAAMLTGRVIGSERDMEAAAEIMLQLGAHAVLVKGGHLAGAEVIDLLHDGRSCHRFRHPRLATRQTHGTGCTLSAAVAAGLAHGHDLATAVDDALDFVHRAMSAAPGLGAGHGPLNHLLAPRPRGPAAPRAAPTMPRR